MFHLKMSHSKYLIQKCLNRFECLTLTRSQFIGKNQVTLVVVEVVTEVCVTLDWGQFLGEQYPQNPWPGICWKLSSVWVEHQSLPSGSVSVMHPVLNFPWNLKGKEQGALGLGLSLVVRQLWALEYPVINRRIIKVRIWLMVETQLNWIDDFYQVGSPNTSSSNYKTECWSQFCSSSLLN